MFKNNLQYFLIIQLLFLINNLCIQEDYKIPKEYISDQDFIFMTDITPEPSKKIYASPNGSGTEFSESKPGSLKSAISKLQAGYALYLKEGTYDVGSGISISGKGAPTSYITISSAPGETAIITSSSTSSVGLFEISGSYLIIENLTFKGVTAKTVEGIVFYAGGQNHIIIRNNIFDSLKTNGLTEDHGANAILLLGENSKPIKQVMIYGNTVTNNVLGYSEAISTAGNCEEIYVIKNTLKKNTNIGIDFYGNRGYCEDEKLDQPRKCVATLNYISESISPYADCAGLYVDGAKDVFVGYNTVEKSQYGIEVGSEERNDDYPVKNIVVQENHFIDNSETGIRVGGFEEDETGVVRDTLFKGNEVKGSNTAVIISKVNNITFTENEITAEKYFIYLDFDENYVKNLKFVENKFNGKASFKMFGGSKISLDEFNKKYAS